MRTLFYDLWAARSAREQRLLAIMLALFAALLLWLMSLALAASIENARIKQSDAVDRLALVRSQADRLAFKPPVARETAQAIVTTSAAAAGFTPSRLDARPDGRAAVTLASARPAALGRWIAALDEAGIYVETIAIRPNSDATVSVDAVFRARRD